MLKSAGRFIFMKYNKEYSSPFELISILQSRGLDCDDTDDATGIISSIGYYRLSGYFYPFLLTPKSEHLFKPGSTLGTALKLYEFDRELRQLVFNQIERIEIAVRSAIVNIACAETNDVFWLTYEDPYPPSWMIAEIIPLGTLTRIYDNIASNKIRKRIAKHFSLTIPVFISWMTVVTLTRNSCCHHARLWNRSLSLRTLTMTRPLTYWVSSNVRQGRIFFTLCILKHFVDIIWSNNAFKDDLISLLDKYPMVDIAAMGFPSGNWQDEPLWSDQH